MTALANRHPIGDEFLLDYAAGAAPEPIALVVATHAALNPQSRETLSCLEAAGGAMLNGLSPASVSDGESTTSIWTRTYVAQPPLDLMSVSASMCWVDI